MPDQTEYFLARSEAEAVQSIMAVDPRAAAAHRELGRLHAERAVAALAGREDPLPPALFSRD